MDLSRMEFIIEIIMMKTQPDSTDQGPVTPNSMTLPVDFTHKMQSACMIKTSLTLGAETERTKPGSICRQSSRGESMRSSLLSQKKKKISEIILSTTEKRHPELSIKLTVSCAFIPGQQKAQVHSRPTRFRSKDKPPTKPKKSPAFLQVPNHIDDDEIASQCPLRLPADQSRFEYLQHNTEHHDAMIKCNRNLVKANQELLEDMAEYLENIDKLEAQLSSLRASTEEALREKDEEISKLLHFQKSSQAKSRKLSDRIRTLLKLNESLICQNNTMKQKLKDLTEESVKLRRYLGQCFVRPPETAHTLPS